MSERPIYHLDYETFGTSDLPSVGAYRYAEDPDTEILLAAIAKDEGEPTLWVNPKYETPELFSNPCALALIEEAFGNPDALIYAHNAQFERAITRYRAEKDLGVKPPKANQWRCTAAMARKAALPDSLEKISETLECGQQKDKRGKSLIKVFSVPQPKTGKRILPAERPEDFAAFGDYCVQDVKTEQEVHKRLRPFELQGISLDAFLLDVYLNDHGMPVNVPALENARRIIDDLMKDRAKEFADITDGLAPTQRQKTFELVRGLGVMVMDMKSDNLLKWVDRLEAELMLAEEGEATDKKERALKVLQLYTELNFAAAKKVHAMLACANSDGYVRGTLLYHGAGTGRWAGRGIQPQNFKKAPDSLKKLTGDVYAAICAGASRDDLEMIGNPLELIAACIRHFVQSPDGDMFDADYAQVEARIVCWLAGQEDALNDFKNGVDQYIKMAARIFKKPAATIENPSHERTVGKHTVLGCGFQMWFPKFMATCEKFGVPVTEELAKDAVLAYREVFYKVKQLWYDTDRAAKNAILKPGQTFTAGKLAFRLRRVAGIPFLAMTLPSRRVIVYPYPKVERLDGEGEDVKPGITFWGQIPGKAFWGRIKTYGGKLVENATQGTAADFMAYGAIQAIKLGFSLITLIHDQALARKLKGQTAEAFGKALASLPDWAHGMPLAADAKEVPYYKK